MSSPSPAITADPRVGAADLLVTAERMRARTAQPPSSQGTGRRGPVPRALPLALARGRDAERRVAGAARVATEVLDDVLRGLRVAGGCCALQVSRLRFHLLGGALKLWPLLPDFRLCLGLVGQ